jgi:phosphoglycolate phosphatase
MQRPAALLFDLDGTLVDSARDIAAALSRLSTSRGGGDIAVQDVRSLVSQGVTILVRQALGTLARDDITDVTEFRAILAELPPDPESIYPGVTESLSLLSENDRPMAIVTNKPEQLSRLLLDQLGLAHFFRVIVGGDTLPMSKPDPAPLLHALGLLGATRDAALMIGDSAVDADAAKAAGIPFALFEGGYGADGCRDADVSVRFGSFDALTTSITCPIERAY